ncbi:MAG: hypothetical protein IIB37_01265 [Gemmatimonadetes bacterium]|nr:hypothetical protein [Gemmatimonadota bacterium]
MRDSAQPADIPSSRAPARSAHPSPSATRPSPGTTRPAPDKHLGEWLEAQRTFLALYWFDEILHRVSMEPEMERVLKRFLDLLTRMIPGALDHRRSVVDPVWKRAAELYGTLGAQRGLAAGDIVEEFQIVREAVVRVLFQAPPTKYGTPLSLSDALRLNRFIDSGVTHASIGHTDGLFFALFQGNGISTVPTAKLVAEVEEQLESLEVEWAAEN